MEELVLNQLPPAQRDAVREMWARKSDRIERALTAVPTDQRSLRLHIARGPNDLWDAHAVLKLPTGTLACSTAGHRAWRTAIEQIAEQLDREVRGHLGRLRTRAPGPRRLEKVGPDLRDAVDAGDPIGFDRLVREELSRIRALVRRELAVAQLEGRFAPGHHTVAEVFEEVGRRAAARAGKRPTDRPLQSWLVELVFEVIDWFHDAPAPSPTAAAVEQSVITLDDPRFAVSDGPASEVEPSWSQDEEERPRLAEVLAGRDARGVFVERSIHEQRARVLRSLCELPRERRRAYLLRAFERWEPEEIAAVQDRTVGEVIDDAETVATGLADQIEAELGDELARSVRRA